MKKQGKQFEWKNLRELLTQATRIEGRYGNYDILRLSKKHHVIVDRTSVMFLASSSGSPYTLPKHWDLWLKRGFIVITFSVSNNNSRYYIFDAKSKKFTVEGERMKAKADAFLTGRSNYFIAGNKRIGYAIFDENGKQISDWYNGINEEGLVSGYSDYYIAGKGGKEAIFHKDGYRISEWYDEVMPYGLVYNQSDYYIAKKDDKKAVFDKEGRQISDWYDGIDEDGLVEGESDYYLAEQDDRKAIFHKDGKQITDWFDDISEEGLFEGYTDYYIAERDDQKAIFHKDGRQVSDWFDDIDSYGLVEGQSCYYIARRDFSGYAIFHKDGSQISDWFDNIYLFGLVGGQSAYYVVRARERDGFKEFDYIYKLGSKKIMGPFKEILDWGFIEDFTENSIIVITSTDQQITLTRQEVEQFFKEKEIEDEK